MTTIAMFAAVGVCAATLVASVTDRAPTPVRLVGENCPRIAPPGASTARIDELPGAPRNVCLVFFEADPDDSKANDSRG
jgi:hypothetical protein